MSSSDVNLNENWSVVISENRLYQYLMIENIEKAFQMDRIVGNIEKMGQLPVPLLAAHMFGKFLLGLGLGILLAGAMNFNWKFWGTVVIVLSFLVSIRSRRRILKN